MNRIEQISDLRGHIAAWRAAGEPVALVPTMGNLHRGHLSLVKEAHRHAKRVVASIFVNPLQFGPGEDLDAYPRTLAEDQRQLAAEGCDLLFTPTPEVMYPRGQGAQTRVEVPGLSEMLCGAARPGHFAGVATVVCKLLNMAQPDVALFGEKDFQQLLVIRRMVEDLDIPVAILGYPTVREVDGLAMSSRNGYLTPEERRRAPALHQVLTRSAAALVSGERIDSVEHAAQTELRAQGLAPDYVQVRRISDLAPPSADDRELIILAAAYLGRARLIDNLKLIRDQSPG